MTTDMKAAIERVREGRYDMSDMPTVLALAEIGRLAVEARQLWSLPVDIPTTTKWLEASGLRDHAADAFLAGRDK